ncbi:hypothetical protein IG195_17850 [Arthrobacter sp. TES]|jgi:hypothetical protein|uniref:Uncharacterized protein n=1 Tax=Paenarthrobacter ureafaciens TaxID=37931 RepID=A0AAX3ENP0_PAEUR|nr:MULTISPECIES: hypothetical protein [Paenarthrobacter]AMB40533.1 hypothetical protein AUT26_10195 [Arthrobacter sp. ATCC 21022]AOY71464.1 hypothetical protein ARZXY2_1920 [Arthrobacter sp. ZXY-2]ERI39384.1 hypothetical protein M707_00095 [Arthrobacter sp. AK-YN10]NKR11620.1 hypothetical protein [Arthrobacter sp. M5]NKR15684.1 hypothetical protein [Arthrobacter sp. M6]OEH63523.1 hypothetical protein A5N17_08925 [Arthrobacter sp. D2]OEH65135.1 hypothetical protein A5N13_00095 [Arthrobacter s
MKWLELLLVAGVTLVSAVTVVVLYSLGVRLTAIAGDVQQKSPALFKSLAYVCFGICGLAVLFGIYLIVPYFGK